MFIVKKEKSYEYLILKVSIIYNMENSLLYLHTPSSSIVPPPIVSTDDEIPIGQLIWEDFEKLCLRIAETIHSIDDCEIYGIKGQKQEGIDIFALKDNNKYSSYQCKRYKNITEDVLEKAVKTLKEGDWKDKSDQFVFCTSFPLNTIQLQKKFNSLKVELKKVGIKFIKWDKIQLKRILKKHPLIVYEFFGKEWVKRFNGEIKLKEIEEVCKLDSSQVAKFRKELYNIYSTVFQQYDPSIPSGEINDFTIQLHERFVVPDFIEKKQFDEPATYEIVQQEDREEIIKNYSIDTPNNPYQSYRNRIRHNEARLKTESRINIDTILPNHNRTIILGEPGSGKSTLLHYIILDLLSTKPQLNNISKKWGKLLPIWLPFAFITKNLNSNPNLNISDLLRLWFKSIDKEFIFDIAKYALEDKRLLLIVDGIDEWTNHNVAKQAISRIEIHIQLSQTKIIYSSRPYGYKQQRDSFSKIQEFYIAPFSELQQRKYISYWYEKWMFHIKHQDSEFVKNETNDFLSEIKKSSDFVKLAENPLLLSILISQRFKYSVLPKNKIKALTTITEHLINHHPIRRRTSANIIQEDDLDFDVSEVFSVLAIYIQKNCHDGIITKKEAQKVIEEYLKDFMDYEVSKAKKLSKSLLDIGANNIGIIIEKSSDDVAFMHRQFQEFMAAKYLFESDKGISTDYIKDFASNPQWNQVITFFFGQIPNMKKNDFNYFISLIEIENDKILSYTHFLKYSLVLLQNNSPINEAKEYLKEVINRFEFEHNFTNKSLLWDILLDSLYNSKIKSDVLIFLFTYFPNNYQFNDYRLKSLRNLPVSQLTQPIRELILKSLINGNQYQKIDASYTIQKFISDSWFLKEVINILDTCSNPEILSYAINCIISDNVDIKSKEYYLKKFQDTEHPKVFLFNIKLKISLKLQTNDDLEALIKIQKNFDYTHRDEIQYIFIDGWPDNPKLLEISIKSINKHHRETIIDSNIAWKILFHCFNKEEIVVEKIIEELKNEKYPFISMDAHRGWPFVSIYFRDNKKIIPEIENWINKQDFLEPEIAYACLVGRTENNKLYLQKNLANAHFPHWYVMALVEGWPNDASVFKELKKYFKGDSKYSYYAAHYIGQVFKDDKKNGIEILERILFNKEIYFKDRAIQPLIELDKKYFKENILERFLQNELMQYDKGDFGLFYNALTPIINNFHDEDIVKNLVINKLSDDSNLIEFIIRYYPNQLETVNKLVRISNPLDKEFRIKMLGILSNKNNINDTVISQLSLFAEEADEIIRTSAAVSYFNFLKSNSPDTIIEICRKIVFHRGHDVDVQRQIAFSGYLITKKLSEYFQLKGVDSNETANPRFIFETSFKEISPLLIKLLIDNFDYLISEIGDNFEKLSAYSEKDKENAWGFWAVNSDVHTPSFQFILDFIKKNSGTIKNQNLIDFLKRTSPQSTLLKNILLRIVNNENEESAIYCGQVLGESFSNDDEVYNAVSSISNLYGDNGKIIALCYGWPNDKKLKDIFDEVVEKQLQINSIVGYNLKFLFRDNANIIKFFNLIFSNYDDAKYEHTRFIKPLYRRIISDISLQDEIKAILLKSSTASEKISYYYILNSVNKIDDEIQEWKLKQLTPKAINAYGYNIMTNKLSSISEILEEVYF